jgi:hypothetical protein
MSKRFLTLFLASIVVGALSPIRAASQDRTEVEVRPAPRGPDGKMNLGPPPGEKGHWRRTRRELIIGDPENSPETHRPSDRNLAEVPFQPWTRAMWDYNRVHSDRDAPHARCKPSAGPRQIGTAYGFEIVDLPELGRAFIFDIGGPHTFRTVYMDGRPHPEDLTPTYYGHSIGSWDGDTLVVDTVGFNERSWIDTQGLLHTDRLHQIERFTRVDFDSLEYEVTIDDPGAYTEPWTAGFLLQWSDGTEIFEYICQDNNQNPMMTVGDDGQPLSRDNGIVP